VSDCKEIRQSLAAPVDCRWRSSWSASRSQEPTLFRIADAFEKATPFRSHRAAFVSA